MTIASRISASYILLCFLALTCGVAGYWGVSKLSASLTFISGPAWNTADGAMEGTIGIEAHMLGIERKLSGDSSQNTEELIREGQAMEEEALGRMLAAGLISDIQAQQTNNKRSLYHGAADKLLSSYNRFARLDAQLSNNFFLFQKFMEEAEEIGDGQVEDLRRNPNKSMSWNSGLRLRWGAADGAMEGQIGMLQRAYYYGRLKTGANQSETIKALENADAFMREALAEVMSHPIFKRRQPSGSSSSYSEVLKRHLATHKKDFDAAVQAYKEYNADLKTYQNAANALLQVVETVENEGDSKVEGEQANINSTIASSYFLLILAVVMSIVIAVSASVWIIRSILVPLNKTIKALSEIAEGDGDLSRRLDDRGNDEISLLAATFNKFTDKINSVLVNVKGATESIVSGAKEIAIGNENLSQRTEEQASSLEETASSMEEMNSTVKQNANSAEEAKRLADSNSVKAEDSSQVVSETVNAMQAITSSSAKISDIINTIDSISFQTNLLALNAAVEAARAGEQGRGFAVVASEVRVLAQNSAESANEIKSLIEDSVNKVKAGSELVEKSGKVLEEIIDGTKKMSVFVAEIAAASREQASGIDQVNNAVLQMDNTTQQNAALVEEAAAASRAMEEQVNLLRQQIDYFKLRD